MASDERLRTEDEVVARYPAPAWLPAGSRAEVVLAGPDGRAPDPTCVVRLLLIRDGSVLTVPRADGAGQDIPSAAVGGVTPAEALAGLTHRILGRHASSRLLGYVRNTVPDPTPHYPWPAPVAHFAVWCCPVPPSAEPDGRWLDAASATSLLAERHWWPLHRWRDD